LYTPASKSKIPVLFEDATCHISLIPTETYRKKAISNKWISVTPGLKIPENGPEPEFRPEFRPEFFRNFEPSSGMTVTDLLAHAVVQT
jgi:hypothetical protein